MGIVQELEILGYSTKEAMKISENENFHHKRKSSSELESLLMEISEVYDTDLESIKKAVLGFPRFAGHNHERVIREATAVYEDEAKVKKAILAFPQFAGLNHERVVREATAVYEDEAKVKKAVLAHPPFAGHNHERVVREATAVYEDEAKVKKAVLAHPPFAGLNHERVVREATAVYEDEAKVKNAILAFPQFAGLNHERVVREATAVYEDEAKVKNAVLGFPRFAGLNHERVVRQKTRLGRLAGLADKETIDIILCKPVLSSYSAKRYLAVLDVARTLNQEGFEMNGQMRELSINYCWVSPYVPGTKRKRISQVPDGEEPPLLTKLRKSLRRNSA